MEIPRLAYRLHSQNLRGKQVDVKHVEKQFIYAVNVVRTHITKTLTEPQAEPPKRKQRGEGYY